MNLPDVHKAVLDEATLLALFGDLQQLASKVTVQFKTAAKGYADADTQDLPTAQESLLAGTVPACQIRYDFDDATWCDTITRSADGFSLVRISLSAASSFAS